MLLHNKSSFEECLKDEFSSEEYFSLDTGKHSGISEGRIYIANTTDSPVEWIDELNMYTQIYLDKDKYNNKSNKAVMMIKYNGSIFNILYGYGRTMLKTSSIVKNFGLRTAINLISADNIKSVNTLNISTDYIDTQRQSFNYVSQNFLDIKTNSEIIKVISGKASSDTHFNSIHGSDALQISVKADTTISEMLNGILEYYKSEQYKDKGFEWIDHIQSVREDRVKLALDIQLVTAIKENKYGEISIGFNKVVELSLMDGYFISGMNKNIEYNNFYEEIPTKLFLDYLKQMGKGEIVTKLKKSSLFFWNNETGKPEKIDKVYNCLLFETEYNEEHYFLNNGDWFRIESNYYTSILQKIQSIPKSEVVSIACEADWGEGDYNVNFVNSNPTDYQLFDKMNYRETSWGKSKIEPADIITKVRQFIHVKKGGASSSLSHLFAQGLVSSQLLKNNSDYRKHIEDSVQEKFGTNFIDNNEVEVVFGIIDKRYNEDFNKFLPVFSMINLCQNYDNILNLGYKCSLLPIELITEPNRTKKESAILQMFNKSSHLSVEQIKEKLPDKYKNLSKRTISNITEKLVNENILQFAMEGKKIYGLTNSSGIL